MLAQVKSGAVLGVDAYLVRVEVDIGRGLPCMNVVGLPASAVREGKERVSAALRNVGYELPPRRITINLAPADVPKSGSAFDLPIALGILAGSGQLPADAVRAVCVVGELGLDGSLRPIRGALAIAARCAEAGVGEMLLPRANAAEAAIAGGARVYGARDLEQVVQHLAGRVRLEPARERPAASAASNGAAPDLLDVRGQQQARRALEVAAAGGHNLLMIGPPGSGKSMLAQRLPGILPPLRRSEAVEVTRIHSVAGLLPEQAGLIAAPPFRAPHHGISEAGLIGGGSVPRPGEISLAHRGVLFLDELTQFGTRTLEAMRQPLEDGVVVIGRARLTLRFPARVTLVAAMNPCPCGYFGTRDGRCGCDEARVRRYRARISGPLWDRFDMQIEVPMLPPRDLVGDVPGEPSADVRARVNGARRCQARRAGRSGVSSAAAGAPNVEGRTVEADGAIADGDAPVLNSCLHPRALRRVCRLDGEGAALLERAIRTLGLSARGHDRVLRVARTIADLDGAQGIRPPHLAEAIQYRSLDREGG